jgi:hypothetical protein
MWNGKVMIRFDVNSREAEGNPCKMCRVTNPVGHKQETNVLATRSRSLTLRHITPFKSSFNPLRVTRGSQCLCCLRRELFSPARMLRPWVRILLEAWMSATVRLIPRQRSTTDCVFFIYLFLANLQSTLQIEQ